MNSIPPKVQNQINMLQQLQQQLQTVVNQKNQYELAAQEARRAKEELGDAPEGAAVYMTVGTIVIEKPREQVLEKLNEKVETFEVRIKSIERQEKALQEKFEKLQAQVRQVLDGGSTPEAA
ncbi:prefoldin subunit beta [Methanospirillum lacunae]|uniref:Prefoldin subunit beta n=1 Tax=Methanospirillum lacunae TaxID=668570 RepID=A0A2V2N376_9EURY|nr:prefoldin subunit beta [Methanospirillum lacunae]PWR69951.1 prefoldin subunit beta [Methanospirillum lacunae]